MEHYRNDDTDDSIVHLPICGFLWVDRQGESSLFAFRQALDEHVADTHLLLLLLFPERDAAGE